MARPLPMQKIPFLSSMPIAFLVALATFLSVLSIVTFLCASHKKKKSPHKLKEERTESQSSEKKILSKLSSNISSKTHLMVKMISWKKLQDGEGDDDDHSEDAIWRRTIILGERCRPLDFSGNIVYDSEGLASTGLTNCGKLTTGYQLAQLRWSRTGNRSAVVELLRPTYLRISLCKLKFPQSHEFSFNFQGQLQFDHEHPIDFEFYGTTAGKFYAWCFSNLNPTEKLLDRWMKSLICPLTRNCYNLVSHNERCSCP